MVGLDDLRGLFQPCERELSSLGRTSEGMGNMAITLSLLFW